MYTASSDQFHNMLQRRLRTIRGVIKKTTPDIPHKEAIYLSEARLRAEIKDWLESSASQQCKRDIKI